MNHDHYLKYRGKCKELAQKECDINKELTLVKGWYYCPIWNVKEQHWWCKDNKGNIVDPSRLQFPSGGVGDYEEYQGTFPCSNCGKEILEKDIKQEFSQSVYILCSGDCYAKFVGL
jgi:hypothetical protein